MVWVGEGEWGWRGTVCGLKDPVTGTVYRLDMTPLDSASSAGLPVPDNVTVVMVHSWTLCWLLVRLPFGLLVSVCTLCLSFFLSFCLSFFLSFCLSFFLSFFV